MRCFYVLVEGQIKWAKDESSSLEPQDGRPICFYCNRYVLASSADIAASKAIQRVRENLEHDWMQGSGSVELAVAEVSAAPLLKGFLPDDRGHTFYSSD